MTIRYSIEFIADLDRINVVYRDILFIPESGKKLISGLLETCVDIEKFPLMGVDLKTKTDFGKNYFQLSRHKTVSTNEGDDFYD